MRILEEFIQASLSYFKAFRFVNEQRLWKHLFWPAGFNLLAFIFMGYIAIATSGWLIELGLDKLSVPPDNWWTNVLYFVTTLLIRVLILLIYLKFYRYIILIFFAPIMAYLAELVQERATGHVRPFSLKQFTRDVLRGLGIAFRNLLIEVSVYLVLLIGTTFLPIISPFVPFVILATGSYFYGFSLIDYHNEFYGLSARESRNYIWEHRGYSMGLGVVFYAMLLIPVLGVLFAPSIAVMAAGMGVIHDIKSVHHDQISQSIQQ